MDHPRNVQDALQDAGLSRGSELEPEQIERARQIANGLQIKSETTRREFIMKGSGVARSTIKKGGRQMATKTRSKKQTASTTKAAPNKSIVRKIAKLRREGKTWDEVIAATGVKTNSTGFRILLEEHGFDKFGREGGKGKSLAKGAGASKDENLGASARGNSASAAKKTATRKPRKTRRKAAAK